MVSTAQLGGDQDLQEDLLYSMFVAFDIPEKP